MFVEKDEARIQPRYRPGHRLEACRDAVRDRGFAFQEAVEQAHRQLRAVLNAMPTWSDLTATQTVALGERCMVWGVIDKQHRELFSLTQQLHELRRAAVWVGTLHLDIPTSWTTAESLQVMADPGRFGLTMDEAEELREERRQIFEHLASSARSMAGLPVSVADTLATHADIVGQREAL